MIASLIATGVSLAASGVGAALKRRRMKKEQARQDRARKEQRAETDAWYKRELYQNALDRSENRALLGHLNRRLSEEQGKAAARGKITGETQEAAVARSKAAGNAMSDSVSSMASGESVRRDSVAADWRRERTAQTQQKETDERARAENDLAAIDTWSKAAADLGTAAANTLGSGKKSPSETGDGEVSAEKSRMPVMSNKDFEAVIRQRNPNSILR